LAGLLVLFPALHAMSYQRLKEKEQELTEKSLL
jgi:hypothetical protein